MLKASARPRAAMLTITDVAIDLHVSTKTVRRWISEGALHAHRLGRQLRVSNEDLALYLSQARK